MMRKFAGLLLLFVCPACCEMIYLPPASWVVFPIAEISDDTLSRPDLDEVIQGRESQLADLGIAVLRNPNRGNWTSRVEGEVVDEHPDENVLLAEFLEDEDLFKHVAMVNSLGEAKEEFILSCSVECIYTIELDGMMWIWNCATLGIGAVIGWPHQNSSASYVLEGVVYDNRGDFPVIVSGSIAENYKEWYCDNIYWRPTFYGGAALSRLFEQMLYDFLADSGCLSP
ncbi:MAG: hypothetical protein ABIK28_09325 [Planctomycetota bacterium]